MLNAFFFSKDAEYPSFHLLSIHCIDLTSVPYKRKKVRNFFRHFRTEILQIPAFFLPPKTGVFVSRQKP